MHRKKHNISDWLRRFSLSKRLACFFIIQSTVVILWCFTAIWKYVEKYENSILFRNSQIISSIERDIDQAYDTIEYITKFPVIQSASGNSIILQYLAAGHRTENYSYYMAFKTYASQLLQMTDTVSCISIMDMAGEHVYLTRNSGVYYNTMDSCHAPYFLDAVSMRGSLILRPASSIESIGIPDKEDMLWGLRAVINNAPFRPIGIVLCAVDLSHCVRSFHLSRIFPEQEFGIFSPDGERIAGTIEPEWYSRLNVTFQSSAENADTIQELRTSMPNNQQLYHYSLTKKGFLCVIRTPYILVLSEVRDQRASFFMLLIFLVISSIAITLLIIQSIRRPISNLTGACDHIRNEDFRFRISDNGRDEMHQLTESFNFMSEKIHYLIEEVYHKDILQTQTELQMLKAQINPHFINNTLESIRAMAIQNQAPEVARMISLFGATLRYGISSSNHLVSLKEELERLTGYIELQKIHLGERLQFNVSVDPAVMDCLVMKILFQPVVENSIYHGFADGERTEVIDVMGFPQDSGLVFKIIDNGNGMPQSKAELLTGYINGENNAFTSIGLKNVHRRIRLFYGDAYGIEIHSVEGKGTVVTIRIPEIRTKEEGLDDSGHSCG